LVYLSPNSPGSFRVRSVQSVPTVSSSITTRLGKRRREEEAVQSARHVRGREEEAQVNESEGGEGDQRALHGEYRTGKGGGEQNYPQDGEELVAGEDGEIDGNNGEMSGRDNHGDGMEARGHRYRKRPKLNTPSSSPSVEITRDRLPSSTLAANIAYTATTALFGLKGDPRLQGLNEQERNDLLEKVFAIGGVEAMRQIRRLVYQLRRGGLTSFLTLPSANDVESTKMILASRTSSELPSTPLASFYLAYLGVIRLKSKTMIDTVARRKALAELSSLYEQVKPALDSSARGYKQRVGQQKLRLFRTVYPAYSAVRRPADHPGPCRSDWYEFTGDLRHGSRWERIRNAFGGDGILALMPPSRHHLRDRRLVASTPRPAGRLPKGRHGGGI